MTREKHDQYCKQFAAELLESKGEVQIQHEISPGEARQADIYFRPSPTADLKPLGLLGKIAATPCLLEHFYNQPTKIELQTCVQKLFTLRSNLLNKNERDKKALPEKEQKNFPALKEEELPCLWILATSASDNLLNFFGGELKLNDWGKGIYFCGALGFRTAIVALNRLPTTPDTLLLRLLGKGQTQQQAIEEVRALKPDNPLRDQVEYLLFRWHICVKTQDELSQDEKELLMNTSEMVEEYHQKIFQQGRQRFQEIGGKLLARFGTIDGALWQVIDPLLKLPPNESSQLIQQSSREELLAKLGH